MDDGAHAVDVKEIGEHEHKNGFMAEDVLQRGPQPPQGLADGALFVGLIAFLLHVFQQRPTERGPPHGRKAEDERQAVQHIHAHGVHHKKNEQRDGGAANIAQAVAHGGDAVHTLFGGDVG